MLFSQKIISSRSNEQVTLQNDHDNQRFYDPFSHPRLFVRMISFARFPPYFYIFFPRIMIFRCLINNLFSSVVYILCLRCLFTTTKTMSTTSKMANARRGSQSMTSVLGRSSGHRPSSSSSTGECITRVCLHSHTRVHICCSHKGFSLSLSLSFSLSLSLFSVPDTKPSCTRIRTREST